MKRMWGTNSQGETRPLKRKTTGFSGKSIKEPRIVSLLVSLIRTMRRYSTFPAGGWGGRVPSSPPSTRLISLSLHPSGTLYRRKRSLP